ncbi:PLP-dependent cysteine synthase family protein [Nonomuraea sediminis]|uniref:PLP-dependent cysteine synthase family protein n=1 Tax=Nonomuraea sediminis TaxID=2835864 RepID=UPI001BDBC56E|nr:cysteine synthase family protein [Nonomuraea sediminis]
MIHNDILSTIGGTPVVRLRRLTVPGTEILIKLEGFNPGGSIKDRAVLSMIRRAELNGRLRPGGTIIESTSGNVGKALALIGAVNGYRVILVVDPNAPRSKLDYVRALGAEIVVVDTADEGGLYQRPRIARVKQLLQEIPGSFWPDQYDNPDNPRAHAEQTSYELLSDVPNFDALVTAVGTGGHISGLSSTLKRELPGLVTVGVDAIGSAAMGFPFAGYLMRGLGLPWMPGCLDLDLVDHAHLVADHEGIATSIVLAKTEGILVGESSGAAVFGALHYALHHSPSRIVVVAADDGIHYLSESFNEDWLREHGLQQKIAAAGLTDPERLIEAARRPQSLPVALTRRYAITR